LSEKKENQKVHKNMKETNLFEKPIKVVNIGISTFAEDLKAQGVEVVSLDWKPPAGGDEQMLKLLDKLGF
jgi:hypothetical protein